MEPMVSPRERARPARRRIAGERSRPVTKATPESPETPAPEEPARRPPAEEAAAEDRDAAPEAVPAEEAPAEEASVEEEAPAEEAPAEETSAEEEPATATAVPAEPEAAQAPAHEPSGGRDRAGWPPAWVPAVLAVLLVVALAVDGFLFWKQQRDQEAAARALHSAVTVAPSVAERAAEAVLSYRYNTFDKDVAEARQYLSDDYRPAYIRSIRDVVSTPAHEIGAVVEAQVLSSGVVDASGERADVLLFVNQTTTSAADTQAQTALNRVVFTMVRAEGTWKVDEIQAF
jgi:Mce-associated membrane protein